MSSRITDTAEYDDLRASHWAEFTARSEPLTNHWTQWEKRSHGWRIPIEILQPVGIDGPRSIEPLRPVLNMLAELEEVDVVPVEWMHVTTVHIGFLMATDIMWSEVESLYANASPRVRRIAPFSLRIGGISATEKSIYVGIDDGFALRDVRNQLKLGVPKIHEVLSEDPNVTTDGDGFVPSIDIGYFTGAGDRQRVIEALKPYRDAEGGEITVDHVKIARIPIQPHDHYQPIDVVARIALFGDPIPKGIPQLTSTPRNHSRNPYQ